MKKNEKKYSDFTDRIKFACEKFGSVARLANETDISVTAINKYRNGQSDPSRSNLIALANATQVDIAWLATGAGNNAIETGKQQFIPIPMMDAQVSTGNEATVENENITDIMKLNKTWLRSALHVASNNISTFSVKNDSMEPTIRSGELVLVEETNLSNQLSDGIYIIRIDGTNSVKRLQFLPQNEINISSDNKLFPPYTITLNDGVDFSVLGRVLISLRSL